MMQIRMLNPLLGALAAAASMAAVVLAQRTQSFTYADVDGHELRSLVSGTGAATVVLENGIGLPLQIWSTVQAELAEDATIIAYDRAGVAGSEEGPSPRDGSAVATELHTMLTQLELPPPYVMVGYSFGGLYVRTFTAMYADEVAALVLIDPTRDDEFDIESFKGSKNAEGNAAPATMLQARASSVPASVPVYLLVAMGAQDPPYPVNDLDKFNQDRREDLEAHTRWLEGVEQSELTVTHGSGHLVTFEQPALIVSMIRKAIAKSAQSFTTSAERIRKEQQQL